MAKALLRAVRARDGDLDDLDILEPAAEPWFIPESTRLLDQLHTFRQRHEHFALVVDEYGGLMGVVTLEDILEEIVGDISDEHDIAVTGVRPQPDGSYMVEGSVTIRDLNREFEWDLPDEEGSDDRRPDSPRIAAHPRCRTIVPIPSLPIRDRAPTASSDHLGSGYAAEAR